MSIMYAGRDVAFQAHAGVSSVKGHICRQFGHCKEAFSKYDPEYRKDGVGEASKWFPLHKAASHWAPSKGNGASS